jgi:hypothetical protein
MNARTIKQSGNDVIKYTQNRSSPGWNFPPILNIPAISERGKKSPPMIARVVPTVDKSVAALASSSDSTPCTWPNRFDTLGVNLEIT